jgi:hypothetical protein
MQLTLRPRAIMLTLCTIVALLTVADIVELFFKYELSHDYMMGLSPLFDFNTEGNLPSFYSAVALLFASVLFFVIAGDASARNDPWQRHWRGLGLIFLFLSIDEAAELHGILSGPLRDFAHLSGWLLFAWVVPYGILTLIVAVAYRSFWWALPPKPRVQLAIAAVIYVVGALGFELLGGEIVSEHGGLRTGLGSWQHAITYTVEELLEMIGALLCINALLQYIDDHRITLSVRTTRD